MRDQVVELLQEMPLLASHEITDREDLDWESLHAVIKEIQVLEYANLEEVLALVSDEMWNYYAAKDCMHTLREGRMRLKAEAALRKAWKVRVAPFLKEGAEVLPAPTELKDAS